MAEPIDYLKTYLNMNPEDYSRMQAQISGETLPEREIFNLQAPVMPKPMPMPATRQAMEPMPMPAPQNTQVQGLMDEIASLKAQIEAMQDTSEPMPAVDEAPVMPSAPPKFLNPDGTPMTGSTGQEAFYNDDGTRKTFLAPPELTNRMVGEPQPIPPKNVHIDIFPRKSIEDGFVKHVDRFPRKSTDGIASISDAFNNPVVSEQIQKSLDMLAKLPKTNIPIIPDMEEIRQKMADANIPFSTPISFQEQLQTIKDLPPMLPVNPVLPPMPASPMLQTRPAPFMPTRARSMLDIQQRFAPQRFAGGGLSKALSELKTRIS